MIKLGVQARDKITGMEGIITARCEYLNGCIQYCIRPKLASDGKLQDGYYFDEAQIEVIGEGLNIPQRQTGGPPMGAPTEYKG